MNTGEIDNKLRRMCGRNFLGVFARDRMPARRPLLMVINTENHNKPGEHWVVICLDRDAKGEFFDSYGRSPVGLFRAYLEKFCGEWICNTTRVQSVISSCCGNYCIFYTYFKTHGFSMKEIMNCFIDDTAFNDLMVQRFVSSN
jgi:hypothetical protein